MIETITEVSTGKIYPVILFRSLCFGDRFRFLGDLEGTGYGPVTQSQNYVDGHFSVDAKGCTADIRSGWTKVVLLHRAPNCECNRHIDYCDNDCAWPTELSDLWNSLYNTDREEPTMNNITGFEAPSEPQPSRITGFEAPARTAPAAQPVVIGIEAPSEPQPSRITGFEAPGR